VQQGSGYHSLISVTTATSSIAGFKLTAGINDTDKSLAMDDLSFSNTGPPPPADFSLSPANGNLVMRQGGSLTDKINIGRFNGSTGNVQLALSGPLPAGVHASFAPNPAGGTSSDLVFTADADATSTGFNPVTLTITGSPLSPAAGPIGHTVQISLQVRSAFDLSVSGPTTVDLAPCEVLVPLSLTRDFGLTDPVSLSVTGLANGITASFSPPVATFPGGAAGQSVTLVVDGPATGLPVPATTLTIHAVAPGLPERTATVTVAGTCPATYDARVTSLQITQGTQSSFLPQVDATRHPPNAVAYSSIPDAAKLRAGGPTVVRVYADLAIGPPEGAPNVPMVLYGATYDRFGQAKALPGSPILPTYSPPKLALGPATADPADVFKEAAAYTFTLPPDWTRAELAVGTGLLPTSGGAARKLKPCETPECTQNDSFQLVHIPMFAAPPITVQPVQLTVDGKPALPDPAAVFKYVKVVDPVETIVQPYAATLNITDISNALASCRAAGHSGCGDTSNEDASGRLDDWVCDHGAPSRGWDIGVNTGVARGLTNPDDICWSSFDDYSDAVVEVNRPLTSVGHEFFHLLGRPHASKSCGGNDNGQTGENWPPDEQGYLQGVGLDTDLGSGFRGGPYALVGDTSVKSWFDFMSYCANTSDVNPFTTGDSWVSVKNWNAAFEDHRYHRSAQRARVRAVSGPRVPSLHVGAIADPDGSVRIVATAPVSAPAQPASESGYHLVGLDGSGNPVVDLQMLSSPTHADGVPPALALDGVIPAAGVAAVQIVRDGAVVATRAASATAPKVALSGLPRFRGAKATIRWRASDADRDALLTSVDYSADGGKTFVTIFTGPDHGNAKLPARMLSRASKARVRVRVNDGFREAAVTSPVFRSPGGPPVVRIVAPGKGAKQRNDAPLVLRGQAFDDASRSLTGKSLRWFVGKRLVGTGSQTAPMGLPAGRRRIRLTARDRFGRVRSASVVVRLTAARPLFLVLAGPTSVKRSARSVALKVSTSLPARLTVRGGARGQQRFFVSRKKRTLHVRVLPGRKRLTLRLTLVAGGKSTPATVSVARR
jgi:hypothetical protein